MAQIVTGSLTIDRSVSSLETAGIALAVAVAIDAIAQLRRAGIDGAVQRCAIRAVQRAVAVIVGVDTVWQAIAIRLDEEVHQRTIAIRITGITGLGGTGIDEWVTVVTVLTSQSAIPVEIRVLHRTVTIGVYGRSTDLWSPWIDAGIRVIAV
jgi:hypothetical protein